METDIYNKITLRALVIAGQWPLEIKNYKYLRYLHLVYAVIVSLYFLWFVISQYIEVINNLDKSFFELVNNLAVSLLYGITILKSLSIRGKPMRKLVQLIRNIEQEVIICDDDEIKKIYMYHVKWSSTLGFWFMIIGYFTAVPYFVSPLIVMFTNPAVLHGEVERPLPFSSWFPFDRQRYYWLCYGMHIISGSLGSLVTASIDILFWSLTIFAIGQLKIIQYKFRNLNQHAEYFIKRGVMTKQEATTHCMKKCIFMHKMLIQYVDDLDHILKYVMLVDFMVCSLQISTVGFQAIVIGTAFEKLSMVEFLLAVLGQLYFFYWHANEVQLESEGIAIAIWEGHMYEYPIPVQKDLQFVMLRAQKSLKLNVGPFYHMSTSTLLSIIRVSYSYVTLLHQFYSEG